MNSVTFLELFYSNVPLYAISFAICILVFIPFFRYRVRGLLDPLLLALVFAACANSVPLFMYFINEVDNEHFTYFVLCELIFWGVLYLGTKKLNSQTASYNITHDLRGEYPFFLFAFYFSVALTLYSYSVNGIPLFNESRFQINVDNSSGFMGMLQRLSGLFATFRNIYIIHGLMGIHRRKYYPYAAVVLVLALLSGSKGFILAFVESFFYYMLFFKGVAPKLSKKTYILIGFTPVLVIVYGGLSDGLGNSFVYFAYRLLANGDVYWNAYGSNVIDNIMMSSPIANMTYFFWGPFRHILGFSVSPDIMTTVGSLAFEQGSGFFPEGGAPNSRLAVASWVYYRWGGLILTFCMALLSVSYFRYCFKRNSTTIGNVCIKATLYGCALSATSDVYLAFNPLFNLMFFVIIYSLYHSILCKQKG